MKTVSQEFSALKRRIAFTQIIMLLLVIAFLAHAGWAAGWIL